MSSLGPSGSNAHGLNFSQAGLRRSAAFPPTHANQHQHQPNKQSPAPHAASPYQPQGYTPQQPPQGTYPPHLFASPVNPNIPNGHPPSRTPNSHVPPNALGVQRQRAAPPRQQMPPQPNPPPMMFPTSMSQSVQHDPILSHQHQQQHPSHQGHPGHPSHQQHPPHHQQQVQQVNQVQASPQQPAAQVPQQQANHAGSEMDVDGNQDGDASEVNGLDSKLLNDPSYVPSQPLGEMMSPPPEGGSYPTLEAVQKAVLRYCTSVGYAIVIGRSKKTVPGLKKVLFVCDRAGKPPSRVSPEFRKRKTSSRKCDCPFGFFAIEQRTQWTIRYRPDPAHLQHNHGPSESPSNHPAARKLDSKMVAAVKQLKENGAGVSETLQILQTENPDCHLLPRDIYNARAAINRNPQKVATGLAENRPAIYTKPQQSPEDRIRADLRRELAKAREDLQKIEEEKQKEIDALKSQLEEKEKLIKRFEMFIDICNERVMVQRERLAGPDGNLAIGGNSVM
ncbi:hypothetical protein MHUMG1_04945 [Metarhizium humberi]|uniref:Transcription factor, FAR1-related protein n=1 Tax=Metarhizium humberi TaxID=2596975 RepID=A0A9P8MA23_9HYPO|nr:hypothetical protein MHUMG1_04945 [Metarhizium humberi]